MNEQFPEQPKSIKVKQSNHQITIIKKWFDCITVFFTGFTLFWSYMSFSKFMPLFLNVNQIQFLDLETIVPLLFGCIFLGFSIFLIYYTIAKWINQTYIYAYDDAIEVRHKPILWKDNLKLGIEQLQNLYSKKIKIDQRLYFEVRAKTNNGADKKLIKVYKKEEALFIEQTLKNYLNIGNEPIKGQLDSKG